MPKPIDIYISGLDEKEKLGCPKWLLKLFHLVKRFLNTDKAPHFLQKIFGVMESPGRLTFQKLPEFSDYQECGIYTVLSANLWHDWPRYLRLRERLESFARLIEEQNVDLVLVQEITRTNDFKADVWLSERLEMAYTYSRVNGSLKIGFEEGVGIYSRFPLDSEPFLKQLSSKCNPFTRRLVIGSSICTPCGELVAISAHLSLLRSKNAVQLHDLQHWVSRIAKGRTVLIGGDFNTTEKSDQIRYINSHWIDTYRMVHGSGFSETHQIKLPFGLPQIRHRLDYIFLKPGNTRWNIVDANHLDSPDGPHSDHKAVLTRLAPIH